MEEIIFCFLIGLGLAAACGFRVFVPMLVLCLGAKTGHLSLAQGFDWVQSDAALIVFGTATVLEVVAYYVPWLDNLLDTIATPAAAIAGTVATASMLGDVDPMVQWALGILAGGGTATVVQLGTVATRAVSTATTGGLGNPIVSTAEAGVSTVVSGLMVLLPLWLAAAFSLVMLVLIGRFIYKRVKRRRPAEVVIKPVA